jgi:regulation of enolase protein 1 (concanavalin A-like superfamily)
MTAAVRETFRTPELDARLRWRCEPHTWRIDPAASRLHVEPDARTDYWQRTHYGFRVDTGHFLFARMPGSFVLTTHVRFRPVHQYDQAGLMVRLSPTSWLKTSVEHEPGPTNRLGVVVTNGGYSDWSTQDVSGDLLELWFRVTRTGPDYLVASSVDGEHWSQLRMAHLHTDDGQKPIAAGLYACSPTGGGFRAEFDLLEISPSVPAE